MTLIWWGTLLINVAAEGIKWWLHLAPASDRNVIVILNHCMKRLPVVEYKNTFRIIFHCISWTEFIVDTRTRIVSFFSLKIQKRAVLKTASLDIDSDLSQNRFRGWTKTGGTVSATLLPRNGQITQHCDQRSPSPASPLVSLYSCLPALRHPSSHASLYPCVPSIRHPSSHASLQQRSGAAGATTFRTALEPEPIFLLVGAGS